MKKNLGTEMVRRYGIVMALALVMMLSVVDIFFVSVAKPRMESGFAIKTEKVCNSSGDIIKEKIPKISQISGPMITEEAASSVCLEKEIPACKDLHPNLWVFLFISFIILLIFNLAWGYLKGGKAQWAWEGIMTAIFISFWFVFDTCAQNLWYPLYVAKLAIAIYIAYLYFFLNKKRKNHVI